MISIDPVWAGALALMVSTLMTSLIRPWLLARGLIDRPGARRSHGQDTARGGGLAILITLLLLWLLLAEPTVRNLAIGLMLGLLGLLGWLDDLRDLPVRVRLGAQLLLASLMLAMAGPVLSVSLPGIEIQAAWLWSGLALVAVIWLINLHNFMDGSDGLAAMQGAWSAVALGVLHQRGGAAEDALLGFLLAGAYLGFLVWNRPPAKLFMGDVGSILLGGTIGWLALSGAAEGHIPIWTSLIVCSLFVVDATATLVRRAGVGGGWYTAHREHAYQRLLIAGWSHGRVLSLYAALNLALVLPVLVVAVARPMLAPVLALSLVLVLLGGWQFVQRRTREEMTS